MKKTYKNRANVIKKLLQRKIYLLDIPDRVINAFIKDRRWTLKEFMECGEGGYFKHLPNVGHKNFPALIKCYGKYEYIISQLWYSKNYRQIPKWYDKN